MPPRMLLEQLLLSAWLIMLTIGASFHKLYLTLTHSTSHLHASFTVSTFQVMQLPDRLISAFVTATRQMACFWLVHLLFSG